MKLAEIKKDNSRHRWIQCSNCKSIEKKKYFSISTEELNPALILCDECLGELGSKIKNVEQDAGPEFCI